jgi:hypothetical protein
MYPEDRVLVAYVPEPEDFELIRREGWYRIPARSAPKSIHAEYLAFYFGHRFGDQKWAIHYYARQRGHELVTRRELFPEQGDHPRADDSYYRVMLGPLRPLEHAITSLRLRRITFIHTTWDRLQAAREINDLFIEGGSFVDRLYATLKERGLRPERDYLVEEPGPAYRVPLAVLCRDGLVEIAEGRLPRTEAGLDEVVQEVVLEAARLGGVEEA